MENLKAEIEKLTEEIYSQLGDKPGMFDTTPATGIEARENFKRLFGRYPEQENKDEESPV